MEEEALLPLHISMCDVDAEDAESSRQYTSADNPRADGLLAYSILWDYGLVSVPPVVKIGLLSPVMSPRVAVQWLGLHWQSSG